MAKGDKRRSRKAGLPPGAMVHIGERKTDQVQLGLIDYNDEECKGQEECSIDAVSGKIPRDRVRWLNVSGLHEPAVLERLGDRFSLHPLTLEDILNTDQRPKLELFGDYLFIVLKILNWERGDVVDVDQLSLVLGHDFVITFQERETGLLDPLKERLRTESSRARKLGPDYLAYAMIDTVVDNYFVVLENLGDHIDLLEERLVAQPSAQRVGDILRLRRQVIMVRKSVWPLREVVAEMERHDTPFIEPETVLYLKDIYDHVVQIMDTVETYKETISGMMDIHLSSVSNRTNDVMKVLTIIATVFIPLTFFVGVYGMNFEHMPELGWEWSYPILLIFMVLVAAIMMAIFKRRKWF